MKRSVSASRFSRAPSTHAVQIKPPSRRPSPYSRIAATPSPAKPKIQKMNLPQEFCDSLRLNRKGIKTFEEIDINPEIKTLEVKNNLLTSFEGLPSLQNLEILDVSGNKIESLKGMPILPKVRAINVLNTPITQNPNYKIGLVILFGDSLRTINGDRILPSDRQMARTYPKECSNLLRLGWQVTIVAPKKDELKKLLNNTSKNYKIVEKPQSSRPKVVQRNIKDVIKHRLAAQEKEKDFLLQKIAILESQRNN